MNAQRKVPTKQGTKRKRNEDQKPRKAQRSSADSLQTREVVQSSEDDWKTKYGRRRSGRLMGKVSLTTLTVLGLLQKTNKSLHLRCHCYFMFY